MSDNLDLLAALGSSFSSSLSSGLISSKKDNKIIIRFHRIYFSQLVVKKKRTNRITCLPKLKHSRAVIPNRSPEGPRGFDAEHKGSVKRRSRYLKISIFLSRYSTNFFLTKDVSDCHFMLR